MCFYDNMSDLYRENEIYAINTENLISSNNKDKNK